MKKILLLFTCSFILLITSFNSYAEVSNVEALNTEVADVAIAQHNDSAIVLEAEEVEQPTSSDLFMEEQQVKLKITSGKYENQIFELANNLSGNIVYDLVVKPGDKVIVLIEEYEDGNINVFITDFMRQSYSLYLTILFVLLIILIGKMKGVKAVITLAVTLLAIVKVLLPAILNGFNPIPVTIGISLFITIFTLFVLAGINPKSISAILGTTGGVLVAGFLAYYVGTHIKLTGMSSEEAVMLLYIPQNISFDFRGLLFSGIILGSLGAVMDIGMSIASAIEEIHKTNPLLTKAQLFSSGMNVGRDVMGTMTNTLILAYTGSSIPLLLLFMAHETSLVKILNLDVIATEIIRSLTGSIGLVVAIPLTAAITSILLKRSKN